MAKVKSKDMVSSGDDSSSSSSSSRESSPNEEGAAQVISDLKASAALKGKGKEVQRQQYKPTAPVPGWVGIKGVSEVSVDWDDINADPELQLWVVRVPEGVKSKHLEGLTIQLPESGLDNGAVAKFTAKNSDYEVFVAPTPSAEKKRKRDDETNPSVKEPTVGQEMFSLVPLIPNHKKNDALYQSRALSNYLFIQRSVPSNVLSHLPSATSSLIASQPSPVPGAILSAEELLDPKIVQSKKIRRVQPAGLKFRVKMGGMGYEGGNGKFDARKEAVPELTVEEATADEGMDVDKVVIPKAEEVKKEKKEKMEKKEKKARKEA